MRSFPIMVNTGGAGPRERRYAAAGYPFATRMRSIPWDVIEPHRAQAMENHSQTLERLKERGGLSPCELLAVLTDRSFAQVHDEPWWQAEDDELSGYIALMELLSEPTPSPKEVGEA